MNPRNTSPVSVMPNWNFLGREKIEDLIGYVQYLGGKMAKQRVDRQDFWKSRAIAAFRSGPDSNIAGRHSFCGYFKRLILSLKPGERT
jgi:hypothetical protein